MFAGAGTTMVVSRRDDDGIVLHSQSRYDQLLRGEIGGEVDGRGGGGGGSGGGGRGGV